MNEPKEEKKAENEEKENGKRVRIFFSFKLFDNS